MNAVFTARNTAHGISTIPIETEFLMNRELFVTDQIETKAMDSLIKQLIFLDRQDPEKEIVIYINTPGGEVRSGLAAYDVIKLLKAPVRTVCIGTAASMGAILFMAGDKREMLPHTKLMIHDPAPGGGSMQGIKPGEMEELLKDLISVRDELCGIIAETTGKPVEEIRRATAKDTYFSAREAVEFGIATGIFESLPPALETL